jgi:hypothetical protein
MIYPQADHITISEKTLTIKVELKNKKVFKFVGENNAMNEMLHVMLQLVRLTPNPSDMPKIIKGPNAERMTFIAGRTT